MLGFGSFPMNIPYVVTARQWQAAKMLPTQFGDNKNRPSKYVPPRPKIRKPYNG